MSKQGYLLWSTQQRDHEETEKYLFLFDPVTGLRDIDFHEITDTGWEHMKSPDSTTTAILQVAPNTTMADIQRALDVLTTKGGYNSVEVLIRNP